MTRKEVVDLVVTRLKEVTSEIGKIKQIEIPSVFDESTRLIGKKAVLDSLGLVNLIISVEQEINDSCGILITIADDRALSMERSPFKSVATLADYICLLIEEQKSKGILITDHLYEHILDLSDSIYILSNGRTHLTKKSIDLEKLGYVNIS